MTLKDIRQRFKESTDLKKSWGLEELASFEKLMQTEAETLYKCGFISHASRDFIAYCNGYQINTGNYETCHIKDTYDICEVSATKKTALEIMEYILNH